MKTKFKRISIIFKIIYFSFLLFTFGYGISFFAGHNLDIFSLLIGLTFTWSGMWAFYALAKRINVIEILNGRIIITKPLFRKKIITDLSKIKYNDFESHGNISVTKGLLLKLEDGKIIELNNKEFENSSEIINNIISNCERKSYIKLKKWNRETRIYTVGILLISISMILIYLINK